MTFTHRLKMLKHPVLFFPSEGSGHFFIIQNHVESFLLFPSSFFFPVFQSSKNRHSKGNFSSIRTRFVQNFWIVVDWIWKSSRRNFFSYQWFESICNWIEACKLMQILAKQNFIQQFLHSPNLIPRIQALSLESIHIHLFLTLKTFLSYPLEMMFLAIKNPLLGRSKKDSIEATGFKLEDCRVEEEKV